MIVCGGGCAHEAEAWLGMAVRGGRYNATAEVIRSEPKQAVPPMEHLIEHRCCVANEERSELSSLRGVGWGKRKVVRLSRVAQPEVNRC